MIICDCCKCCCICDNPLVFFCKICCRDFTTEVEALIQGSPAMASVYKKMTICKSCRETDW